jgi:glycosyltransferase involved in cell wall biosynthesis
MAASDKVAVVIPCFNHGAYLGEALKSLGRVGGIELEPVVVDDGSTDQRTTDAVNQAEALGIRVIRQKNAGLAAARNAGVKATSAEFIVPLDADDRLRTEWLAKAVEILQARPEVGVVYGDAEQFGVRTGRWRVGEFNADQMLHGNYIHATALYRRDVWDGNGGYDGAMPVQGYEDWDFWMGAMERGWEFAYVPQIFFEYRQHQQSMITEAIKSFDAVWVYVAKKHGVLYWRAWKDYEVERESIKATSRLLSKLVKARIRGRFTVASRRTDKQQ